MQERGRIVVAGLVLLMLILWLGFAVHRSPRFAGSLAGGILGVSGAALFAFCFTYVLVKRVPVIKYAVTQKVPMRALLAWHVYTGIAGGILGLLHTGHKFESVLGILLTSTMLLVVLTGFIGRHLLSLTSQEVRDKRETLSKLQAEYDRLADELSRNAEPAFMSVAKGPFARFRARLLLASGESLPIGGTAAQAVRLAESIADVDYAIKTHDAFKRAFGRWLAVHIVLSVVLILLLGLHIWAGIHYGLRWFR